jgi:WD40 repeat protein
VFGDGETRTRAALVRSDGRWVVTGGVFGNVVLWDGRTGEFAASDDAHGRLVAMCFTPSERYVVSAGDDGVIAVHTLAD